MRLSGFYKEFNEFNKEINKRIERAEAMLSSLPEGRIMISNYNGKSYYVVKKHNGKFVRHRINKDPELIKNLKIKMYIREELLLLYRLRDFSKKSEKIKEIPLHETIIKKLCSKHHITEAEIIYPYSEPGNVFSDYEKSTYRSEDLIHRTRRGLCVRSKSEQSIAEALDAAGVNYHYEEALHLNGKTYYPDFICYSSNGKKYYWEHFGMMKNVDYRVKNQRKLAEYESINIVPWDNLLITYDNIDGDINLRYVDALIEAYLV